MSPPSLRQLTERHLPRSPYPMPHDSRPSMSAARPQPYVTTKSTTAYRTSSPEEAPYPMPHDSRPSMSAARPQPYVTTKSTTAYRTSSPKEAPYPMPHDSRPSMSAARPQPYVTTKSTTAYRTSSPEEAPYPMPHDSRPSMSAARPQPYVTTKSTTAYRTSSPEEAPYPMPHDSRPSMSAARPQPYVTTKSTTAYRTSSPEEAPYPMPHDSRPSMSAARPQPYVTTKSTTAYRTSSPEEAPYPMPHDSRPSMSAARPQPYVTTKSTTAYRTSSPEEAPYPTPHDSRPSVSAAKPQPYVITKPTRGYRTPSPEERRSDLRPHNQDPTGVRRAKVSERFIDGFDVTFECLFLPFLVHRLSDSLLLRGLVYKRSALDDAFLRLLGQQISREILTGPPLNTSQRRQCQHHVSLEEALLMIDIIPLIVAVLKLNNREYPLYKGVNIIGRNKAATVNIVNLVSIRIQHNPYQQIMVSYQQTYFTILRIQAKTSGSYMFMSNVSESHAVIIEVDETQHYISDMNSSNGTYLHGGKLKSFQLYDLNDGSHIIIGNIDATYHKLSQSLWLQTPVCKL
nr:unnamed protein product [Callosobruchus analis]